MVKLELVTLQYRWPLSPLVLDVSFWCPVFLYLTIILYIIVGLKHLEQPWHRFKDRIRSLPSRRKTKRNQPREIRCKRRLHDRHRQLQISWIDTSFDPLGRPTKSSAEFQSIGEHQIHRDILEQRIKNIQSQLV